MDIKIFLRSTLLYFTVVALAGSTCVRMRNPRQPEIHRDEDRNNGGGAVYIDENNTASKQNKSTVEATQRILEDAHNAKQTYNKAKDDVEPPNQMLTDTKNTKTEPKQVGQAININKSEGSEVDGLFTNTNKSTQDNESAKKAAEVEEAAKEEEPKEEEPKEEEPKEEDKLKKDQEVQGNGKLPEVPNESEVTRESSQGGGSTKDDETLSAGVIQEDAFLKAEVGKECKQDWLSQEINKIKEEIKQAEKQYKNLLSQLEETASNLKEYKEQKIVKIYKQVIIKIQYVKKQIRQMVQTSQHVTEDTTPDHLKVLKDKVKSIYKCLKSDKKRIKNIIHSAENAQ